MDALVTVIEALFGDAFAAAVEMAVLSVCLGAFLVFRAKVLG